VRSDNKEYDLEGLSRGKIGKSSFLYGGMPTLDPSNTVSQGCGTPKSNKEPVRRPKKLAEI
jgi:hypothetical protein